MATKNVESVFSGRVKHWKDLELYRQVRALVHGFSCYIKSSVIDFCKDWYLHLNVSCNQFDFCDS